MGIIQPDSRVKYLVNKYLLYLLLIEYRKHIISLSNFPLFTNEGNTIEELKEREEGETD